MDHPRTAFHSRLKPPTPVSAIMNASKKTINKVLQPLQLNKEFESVPVRPPATRALSRRSRSCSDLRTASAKNQIDPLGKKKGLTNNSNTIKPLTKATSVTNIHASVKKPTAKPTLRTISEKSAINQMAGPSCARPVKRVAPSAQAEVKAKVPKPAKPAPYDYKARFNLLTEKHTSLVQAHKDMKEKYSEVADNAEKYIQVSEEFEKLKKQSTEVEEELRILKDKWENLQAEYKNKSDEHCKLQQKYTTLICNHELITATKVQLESEVVTARNQIQDYEEKLHFCKTALLEHEESRRVMHNQIQDLKGTIRVFCRVRPSKQDEDFKLLCNITYVDEATLEIKKSKESVSCISGKPADLKLDFTFDKVFPPEATQAEVFEELSQLVQSALDGYHICVFAYGQTGSGKTYTMQGEPGDSYSGMIPRTINLIFNIINKLKQLGWEYEVEASFLEIYNETIRDLLDPTSKEQREIRFNEGKGTTVTNLTTKIVRSADELKYHMVIANRNRAVAVTNYNEHSSRSHSVTKITLTGQNEEMKTVYVGSLSLVDLAGSESAKTSNSERLVETKNINKSLSTLGTVMSALHNREQHIPYRNSKLTYLLQSSLGGNSKTLMFVNIAPFEECYGESVNALRFAAKVKEVKIGSRRNKTFLKRELSNLNKP